MVAVQVLAQATDMQTPFLPDAVLKMAFYCMNRFIFQWDGILI